MFLLEDKYPDAAPCRGRTEQFIWSDIPSSLTAERALDICDTCPFQDECLKDMKRQGDKYRYQVRAGKAWWIHDPEPDQPVPKPKRSPGRPRGPLSADYVPTIPGDTINPHTRGHHNL